MKHWLVKSEPHKYSWQQLLADKHTFWDGVRNYQARNFLKEMQPGDLVMYYHSNEGKEIVGIAEIIKAAYPDPTTDDDRWVAVDLKPLHTLKHPVTLDMIKAESSLANIGLVRQGRLSVMPLTNIEFDKIIAMADGVV